MGLEELKHLRRMVEPLFPHEQRMVVGGNAAGVFHLNGCQPLRPDFIDG
jgi:hypothetical protein